MLSQRLPLNLSWGLIIASFKSQAAHQHYWNGGGSVGVQWRAIYPYYKICIWLWKHARPAVTQEVFWEIWQAAKKRCLLIEEEATGVWRVTRLSVTFMWWHCIYQTHGCSSGKAVISHNLMSWSKRKNPPTFLNSVETILCSLYRTILTWIWH